MLDGPGERSRVAHPFGTVCDVTFRLTVAASPTSLVDALADELSRPLADPFTSEVVAVPGDGVRSWLTARLAERLGSTPAAADGIVANIDFMFPASLVRRALGEGQPGSAWDVGPLTWVIYEVLHEHAETIGRSADAVQCRSIADLFDRYALHRTAMVRNWERHLDVDPAGKTLPVQLRWQPRLWRAVLERLGAPSGASEMALAASELRIGRRVPLLPERVFLVGLASLPAPHLGVLAALATQVDVHLLAPVPSITIWTRVHGVARKHRQPQPVGRAEDPSAGATGHPLASTWGRAPREAQFLLALTAVEAEASVTVLEQPASADTVVSSSASDGGGTLGPLQADLVADRPPPGAPVADLHDERLEIQPDDQSVQWHRCHGAARQAEVVRDVVLRMLQEHRDDGTPSFEPRDIAILCPDLSTYAPLLEAAFAGDPDHGVPRVPLEVADRSLRQDNPLLDTVAALVELLDGRFRSSDVLDLAASAPVRRRFGLTFEQIDRITRWVEQTNIRWGLDPQSHERFGVPADLGVHTWQAGLDQLLVGATMADPLFVPTGRQSAIGPGDTVPFPDVEGDDVDTVGVFADLLHELGEVVGRLTDALPVGAWCRAVADAARRLCAVPDAESWQWRALDRVLEELENDAVVAGRPCTIPIASTELSSLLLGRLGTRPGRARFGTGAVTVSSLTAQRGVPHRVICLLGLDGDLGSGHGRADDLTVAFPCVGDRDPRSELRAQLLDAVLAAGDRLVICSTGRDVRTNAGVPPAVALAELVDVIDATFRPPAGTPPSSRASEWLAIDHPRQAWSERNFLPGGVGDHRIAAPWSFDRGALEAARARLVQDRRPAFITGALPDATDAPLTLGDLEGTLRNPVRTLLAGRLGVSLAESDEAADDLVPLSLGGLPAWRLRDECLAARLRAGDDWDLEQVEWWERRQRRTGSVPPLQRGERALREAADEVDGLIAAFGRECASVAGLEPVSVPIEIPLSGGRLLTGAIAGVRGLFVVDLTVSKIKPLHSLLAWCRLAALTLVRPEAQWEALIVGRNTSSSRSAAPQVVRFRLQSPESASEVLGVVVDFHDRARRCVVPALPATTDAVYRRGIDHIADGWEGHQGSGDRDDRWVRFAMGNVDPEDLAAEPPLADESGDGWSDSPSRIARWATRLWGSFEATVEMVEPG